MTAHRGLNRVICGGGTEEVAEIGAIEEIVDLEDMETAIVTMGTGTTVVSENQRAAMETTSRENNSEPKKQAV